MNETYCLPFMGLLVMNMFGVFVGIMLTRISNATKGGDGE